MSTCGCARSLNTGREADNEKENENRKYRTRQSKNKEIRLNRCSQTNSHSPKCQHPSHVGRPALVGRLSLVHNGPKVLANNLHYFNYYNYRSAKNTLQKAKFNEDVLAGCEAQHCLNAMRKGAFAPVLSPFVAWLRCAGGGCTLQIFCNAKEKCQQIIIIRLLLARTSVEWQLAAVGVVTITHPHTARPIMRAICMNLLNGVATCVFIHLYFFYFCCRRECARLRRH